MSGYTPLFQSITTGTLCGKWPDIGLWPIVLSLADKHGIVDVTHQYIATITGLPIDEVVDCMDRFCAPDPMSRTTDNEGRRLELIDDDRSWGWRVINHRKYSEKVRLMHKSAREVESGKNKERLAGKKKTAAHRRSPPQNAPQSQAQAQSQTKSQSHVSKASKRAPTDYRPPDAVMTAMQAETGFGTENLEALLREMKDHEFTKPKKDWDAVYRNWVRNALKFERTPRRKLTYAEQLAADMKAMGISDANQ